MATVTLADVALMVGDSPVRKLTADEVMRMVEVGALREDNHTELLHGVLVDKMNESPPHVVVSIRLTTWMVRGLSPDCFQVRHSHPARVADQYSLPEPDLLVVPLADTDPRDHPRSGLLAVEVAVSSRKTDLEVKSQLYSATDIAEYWVVDVTRRRLVRFTEPQPDGYARTEQLAEGPLAPIGFAIEPIELAALFAGLE